VDLGLNSKTHRGRYCKSCQLQNLAAQHRQPP